MAGEPPRSGSIPGWGEQQAEESPTPAGGEPATPPSQGGWQAPPPAAPEPAPGTWQQPSAPPPSPPAPGTWQQAAGGPSGPWTTPPPPAKTGMSTGLKLVIGCLVLLVLLGIAGFALLAFVGSQLERNLGVTPDGELAECPFLTDDEARAVLRGPADAMELTGLFEATIGLVLDARVLPDAPDCWIADGERAFAARVALYQGGDAADVYAREHEAAQPVTEDQGGGISVTDPGYDGGDVAGLGDEAFCTGVSPAIMAGVVVRQGDRVVYASVGSTGEDAVPPFGLEGEVVTSPEQCALAQELARAVLD